MTTPQTKLKPSRLPPMMPIAVPRRTAWQLLGIGETKLDQLVASGELASYREGSARRILMSSINDYISRRVAASATDKS
jgi:excisionase family DNA binding protein